MKAVLRRLSGIARRIRARNRVNFVTLPKLNRALNRVWGELKMLGFATKGMDSVQVSLVPTAGFFSKNCFYNGPYGFFDPESDAGEINIPSVSLSALQDLLGCRPYVSLSDVLRHEYAHALEHHHRNLIHCKAFERAFGLPHDAAFEAEFDPDQHVSRYAASCVGQEDFAETFMFYVKHAGILPKRWNTPAIRRKWRYMAELAPT